MKALRKVWLRFFVVAAAIAGISVFYCANPVDEPPLKWRSAIELPVTNDTFYVAQEFRKLFKEVEKEKIDILWSGRDAVNFGWAYSQFPDSLFKDTVQGDTAVFSVLRIDSISYEVHEDSMESKLFHPMLGPITIANVGPLADTLPLPVNPADFTISADIPLPKIYQVSFNAGSPDLVVTVRNNSTVPVTCTLTVFNSVVRPLGDIAPGETQTANVPVTGYSVNGTLPVRVQGTAATVAGKELVVSFNVNGLVADYARIDRSLISFKKYFINDYKITDTVNIDHIDIGDGYFHYSLRNYTDLNIAIRATHQHLWFSTYCIQNDIQSIAELGTAGIDSSKFDGQLAGEGTDSISGVTSVFRHASYIFNKKTLAAHRLYPQWDPNYYPATDSTSAKGASVTRVIYEVSPSPLAFGSDTVTVSAGDSIVFEISSPYFKFTRFLGTVMEPYKRSGDTQTVAVPFPWNESSKDSLRGKFILQNVFGDIFLKPRLPVPLDTFQPFIDTLQVQYTLQNTRDTTVRSEATSKFIHVINDSLFRQQADLTDIVNDWPDSMQMKVDISVPVGTRLRAVTDLVPTDPDYNKYIGRMMIKALTTVRMNAVLHWEVLDTANLDMGSGKFAVPQALRYFNKMDRKFFSFNMNAYNNSNVYMTLYALVAPYALIDTLDSMSVNQSWNLVQDTVLARSMGYVSFLGPDGIGIPPRSSAQADSVVLNDWQIRQILGSDTCGWRWHARFLPMNPDALHDTDYIKINSWMHMEGDNNMDSLLIWNNDD
ncbi:MAG: hypothetical protein JW768_10975 [Chitinispirillaceae bacterium]|nr:hypothetical protein [Chitinispirillaceae bacterium]